MHGNFGVALIDESWFSRIHNNDIVSIPNYSVFRRDLVKRKGGGVCVHVRHDISLYLCKSLNKNCFERIRQTQKFCG